MSKKHLITVKLYGFDALAREFIEIGEVKRILKESKKRLLRYKWFKDTVDFVLIDIKSENYHTDNMGDNSFCVIETISTGKSTNLKNFIEGVVVGSLEKLFDGKNVLFLAHHHEII